MLLFITEVLAGTGELVQQHRRGNRVAGVELEAVEAVALQPDGLFATIFRQLVAVPRCSRGSGSELSVGANWTLACTLVRSRSVSENA